MDCKGCGDEVCIKDCVEKKKGELLKKFRKDYVVGW